MAVGDYGIAVTLRRVRDGHMFSVVGHYGLSSGTAEERVSNSRELAAYAAERPNVAVLGDFNLRPCSCFLHVGARGAVDLALMLTLGNLI